MKFSKRIRLILTVLFAVLALAGLALLLEGSNAVATTSAPGYDIVLPMQDAPVAGRPAPYGQWIVTHNAVSGITTTLNYGTVARTNGYDEVKALICDNSGSYTMTVNLYGRTTSTGSLYNLSVPFTTVNPGASAWVSFTEVAPWMSVGITTTNATTGTTATCGIYVFTP